MPDLAEPDSGSDDILETWPKSRKSPPARFFTGIDSFARLVANKTASGGLSGFKAKARAMPDQSTQSLIASIATTSDALTLWAIHLQLEKRSIAPAQRWPGNTGTDQMLFVTWCADLSWFIKHHPTHKPRFKNWQHLFRLKPCGAAWLEKCYWLFSQTSTTHGRSTAYKTSRALALTDSQRLDLVTVPTRAMVKDRAVLGSENLESIRARLMRFACLHPDKAGIHTPTEVSNQRTALYLVHALSGKHAPTTARNWQALTGKAITRQTVNDRLSALDHALKLTADF